MALTAAVTRSSPSRAVSSMRCREQADRRRSWPARSRDAGPRGVWPGGRRCESRSRLGLMSTISLRRRHVWCGPLGRAARRRTAAALQSRGDRDGDDDVGDPGTRPRQGTGANLRVAERGVGHRVVDPTPMGARAACTRRYAGGRIHVARGRRAGRADRDRPRATVATDRATRGASMCRSHRTVVMSIVVCSSETTGPPTWIVVGA